jgi:hypothetical protein
VRTHCQPLGAAFHAAAARQHLGEGGGLLTAALARGHHVAGPGGKPPPRPRGGRSAVWPSAALPEDAPMTTALIMILLALFVANCCSNTG